MQDQKRYQCRHIFTDGHRCGSPCLRGQDLCYYHHTTRKPAADPRTRRGRRSTFTLPLPEDRSAIQHSIGEVLQRIAANDIDPRRAGLLLYGLQIASLNLPKPQPKTTQTTETVDEVTTHPQLGHLAPAAEFNVNPNRPKSLIATLIEELNKPKPEPEPKPEPAILPEIQACDQPLSVPRRPHQILSPQQSNNAIQRRRPICLSRMRIMPQRLHVQADRKALLRPRQVNQRRPQHTIEHRIRMIQRLRQPAQTMQQLLMLVQRSKDRTLPPNNIDIALETSRRLLRNQLKVEPQAIQLISILSRIERPRIALRRKHSRARRIQRPQRMHQRRKVLHLRQMIQIVGILTQVDKPSIARRIRWIRPGNYQHRIVGASFDGPLGDHALS
jgi:hypothetical protein